MIAHGSTAPSSRLRRLLGEVGLDEMNELPLYFQLEQILRNRLRAGRLKSGDRLPTEKELQEYFGVSRVTVRQALDNLVRDGLINRHRGRGTEVNPPKIEIDLEGLRGFTAEMEARGFQVRTEVLNREKIPARDHVAEGLQVDEGRMVWRVERLRYVNDETVVHFDTYLPGRLRLPSEERLGSSIYGYLEGQGLVPVYASEMLEAVLADSKLASKLSVRTGLPLLRRVRMTEAGDHRRIAYAVGHYRGDRYRYCRAVSRDGSLSD